MASRPGAESGPPAEAPRPGDAADEPSPLVRLARALLSARPEGIMTAMTGVRGIDSTIHKTKEWLAELSAEVGWKDRHRAYSALRAVLHALRDRLPISQAVSLGAQLPLLVRGVYYEGWRPSDVPLRVRHREDFLDLVREELDRNQAITEDPEKVISAVLGLLCRHNEAEMRKIASTFPKELSSLFPFGGEPEREAEHPQP